jgi:hypothetical protein
MRAPIARNVLAGLIYAQVALCFAGAATVLMRDRGDVPYTPQAETHMTSVQPVRL